MGLYIYKPQGGDPPLRVDAVGGGFITGGALRRSLF